MAKKFSYDGAEVDWYGEEVIALFKDATADGLEASAFEGEGVIKNLIEGADLIDTGFMVNAIYAVGHKSSSYGAAAGAQGLNPSADLLAEAELESELEAVIAGGAEYTIYQEARVGFMYNGLLQVADRVGANVVKASKDKGF